jgi:hypothetical protein
MLEVIRCEVQAYAIVNDERDHGANGRAGHTPEIAMSEMSMGIAFVHVYIR